MNYLEAKRLADLWTKDHDPNLDGWRSVIKVLADECTTLEQNYLHLMEVNRKLRSHIEALALDLGITNQDFVLQPVRGLSEAAQAVREMDGPGKVTQDTDLR